MNGQDSCEADDSDDFDEYSQGRYLFGYVLILLNILKYLFVLLVLYFLFFGWAPTFDILSECFSVFWFFFRGFIVLIKLTREAVLAGTTD